ncbi:hypothetical protein CKK33_16395 [Mucilaginibacter sp. MD40]|uniref:hypothetical protein n=1 Tax=Mucilaginibacter sp. MD40 TaxID=2029590 RepID=UPI000BACC3FD|nr:hypothetical protein [Mucilaginibacter sp. MD40]PAW94992.1 hypothetical protein CKK33_16395 [Mucilaginibacter sp. MD40]
MKKLLSLAFILLAKTTFCQTEQPRYRSPKETVGETYFVLATKNRFTYGLLKNDKDEYVKGDEHKNLKLKLIKIDKKGDDVIGHFIDTVGNTYSEVVTNEQFILMISEKDIEDAKKIYLGKTVWTNPSLLPVTVRDTFVSATKVERFKKYTVKEVSMFPNYFEPIKLTLQPESGPALIIAGTLTGTNVGDKEKVWLLSDLLFLQDPKTLYHFTQQTWDNIKIDYVAPGMDKDAVRLILGKPQSINNSASTGKFALDQWVYPYEYVYFEGGKFKSRQSK